MTSPDIVATLSPLPSPDVLEQRWRTLEQRSDSSFFLSWTWIGSWLQSYDVRPELLSISRDGQDIALALTGSGRQSRLLGAVPALWINQSGIVGADRPFIEYNGLLAAHDDMNAACEAAMQFISARSGWRILQLAGVEPDSPMLRHGEFRRRTMVDESPAYMAELDKVRAANGDYLSLLSSNTRSQIKRSVKDYGGALPEVAIASASDIAPWIAEMRALNAGRHADNAWDDDGFVRFAETIAANGLHDGNVELLRLTSDSGGVTGLLLNFIHGGRAMNYQSAFADPLTPKAKPGLMCHAAAVAHYAGRGLDAYSFLAGKDRYKQSLSTTSETLQWWTLERFSPRLEIEALLRRLLKRPASA